MESQLSCVSSLWVSHWDWEEDISMRRRSSVATCAAISIKPHERGRIWKTPKWEKWKQFPPLEKQHKDSALLFVDHPWGMDQSISLHTRCTRNTRRTWRLCLSKDARTVAKEFLVLLNVIQAFWKIQKQEGYKVALGKLCLPSKITSVVSSGEFGMR